MTNQTTNNSVIKQIGNFFGKQIGGIFGKTLALAFLFAVMAGASYAQCLLGVANAGSNCPTGGGTSSGGSTTTAQSTNLYYQNGGAFYGTVTAYQGSHFEIYTNGTVIKTFKNSCKPASSNGVAGVVCSFGQFDRQGRHIYSGWGYFFQNGYVYLMWTNENMGAYWRQINTGWYGFRP